MPADAWAQAASQPYTDPYTSGPTRPFDGSSRTGVYSAKPAPSYEAPRRTLGSTDIAGDNSPNSPSSWPPIWRGLYAGVQTAGRWAQTRVDGSDGMQLNTSGLQIGGFIGSNLQAGNFVYGVETDVMLGGASSSATVGGVTGNIQDTWTANVRGRVGFAIGQALVYGTGGVAIAGQDYTASSGAFVARTTATRVGSVIGGGIEYKFAPQIAGRLEGLHYSYADSIVRWPTTSQSIKQDSNVLRAGLSFQFN